MLKLFVHVYMSRVLYRATFLNTYVSQPTQLLFSGDVVLLCSFVDSIPLGHTFQNDKRFLREREQERERGEREEHERASAFCQK